MSSSEGYISAVLRHLSRLAGISNAYLLGPLADVDVGLLITCN
jgi:hypothetical protein